ncbi:MAG: hypothetical protein RR257_07495 [Rikenellaceae bacterium]
MEEKGKSQYVKRTQRDYTMSFKLAVVQEIESCELSIRGAMCKYGIQSHGTILNWVRKLGNFDRELHVATMRKIKTPEQELLSLRAEVEVLKKQKAFMERELNNRVQKAIMFDAIVQVVQEDYNIDLLKKVTPERCTSTLKKADKE